LQSVNHIFLQANSFNQQAMPEEVCALRSSPGLLTLLWADCHGDQASSMQCDESCCTTCFSGTPSDLSEEETVNTSGGAITHADSGAEALEILKKMAPDGGMSLEDSLSPQFKAYSWLVQNDMPFDGLEDVRLLQRYGMATLYFSLAGHGWIDQKKWLSADDVCEWDNVEECNSARMVTDLELYSNNLVGRIPYEITHIRMLGKFSPFGSCLLVCI